MQEEIKKQLIERYKYLYENKEIILSLAIKKCVEVTEINKSLDKLRKSKRDLKKHKYIGNYEDLLRLLDISIDECKKSLKTPKYYLFKQIDSSLLSMLEEFLLSDLSIEHSQLYNYIVIIKSSPKILEDLTARINGLKERRNQNRFIKNTEAFTVWKILTYVRDNNLDDETVLLALDKYYNLERYMLTGINWNSGYIYLQIDEIMNAEYLNNIDIEPLDSKTTYTDIISIYKGNEFEQEDDYYDYEWLHENEKISSKEPTTEFVKELLNSPMLNVEDKRKLYYEINSITVKTINEGK